MFHQRFLVDLEGSVKRTYQRDVLGDRDSCYADCSNHSWVELIIASRDDEHRHNPPSSGASLRQRRRIDPHDRFKLQALRPLDHRHDRAECNQPAQPPWRIDRQLFAENPPGEILESFGSSGSPYQTSRYCIMLAAIAAGVSSNSGTPIAAPRSSLMDTAASLHLRNNPRDR